MGSVARVSFENYGTSVARALDLVGAGGRLPADGRPGSIESGIVEG